MNGTASFHRVRCQDGGSILSTVDVETCKDADCKSRKGLKGFDKLKHTHRGLIIPVTPAGSDWEIASSGRTRLVDFFIMSTSFILLHLVLVWVYIAVISSMLKSNLQGARTEQKFTPMPFCVVRASKLIA